MTTTCKTFSHGGEVPHNVVLILHHVPPMEKPWNEFGVTHDNKILLKTKERTSGVWQQRGVWHYNQVTSNSRWWNAGKLNFVNEK